MYALNMFLLITALVLQLNAAAAANVETAAFSYDGDNGPQNWSKLDPSFSLCSTGTTQSPVDINNNTIKSFINETVSEVKVSWPTLTNVTLLNEGVTLKMEVPEGAQSTVSFRGKDYKMSNMHLHAGSEHFLSGEQKAMEAHFVHKSAAGDLLVVSSLVNKGNVTHPFYSPFLQAKIENKAGAKVLIPTIDFSSLLGSLDNLERNFEYKGSLTTPPCSEGVQWIISSPNQGFPTISDEDLAFFQSFFPKPSNSRPIQRK